MWKSLNKILPCVNVYTHILILLPLNISNTCKIEENVLVKIKPFFLVERSDPVIWEKNQLW